MGQEIVYCSFCQTRLIGSDFDKGRAFRSGFRISCKTCQPLLVEAVPQEEARPPRESRPPRKGSSTHIPPVVHRESSTGRQVWPFALAGGVALLVVLLAAFSGARPARPPARPDPEPVAVHPTPEPTPAPRESPPPPPKRVIVPERVSPPPPPTPIQPPPKPLVEASVPAPPTPPPPESRPDPEALKRAREAAQEALKILAAWSKDQQVLVEVFDETGAPRTVEGTVLRVERSRMHVRTNRGKMIVEFGEVTPGSLASFARSGADLLRTFEKELAPESEKEQAARRLFHAAEREHLDYSTRVDGVSKFAALLRDHGETAFVARNRTSILDRADSGKEYWFFPGNMAAGGAMKPARHPKAGDCFTAAAEVTESSATTAFSTLPGASYRCWVYVGGCCGEVLTFQAEGSELTASRVRNSISVLTRHSGHGGPKQPSKWGWASLPLPNYAAPGAKTLRLIANQTGFSVAVAIVSSVRKSPPTENEVRDADRPEASEPVPPGLELWLRFGEATKDSSGRGNVGFIVGEAKLQDQAIAVDRDGHVRVADAPHLRFKADQSFTVAAWVRASERRGGYQGIVTKSRDQKPHYGLWTGHGKWVFGGSQQNIEAGSVATEWQHVVGVQDAPAGKRTLYVNGLPVGSTGAQPGDGPGELRVGSTPGPTEYFGGMIDDVRIYSKALTAEEVALLHKQGR